MKSDEVEIKVAESEEEIHAALRLRYEVFIEEIGFKSPAEFSKPEEKNGRDHSATHIIAVQNGEVVATLRLIKVDAQTAFQGAFNLPFEFDFSKALEISRLAVKKNKRGRRDLFPKIVKFAHYYARERGYDFLCGVMRKGLMDFFNRKKWEFRFQSAPFSCQKYPTVAFILPILESNLQKF
ncbi:MAG: GNAT family N-acyltransferase [Patescibacteria group bacterium]